MVSGPYGGHPCLEPPRTSLQDGRCWAAPSREVVHNTELSPGGNFRYTFLTRPATVSAEIVSFRTDGAGNCDIPECHAAATVMSIRGRTWSCTLSFHLTYTSMEKRNFHGTYTLDNKPQPIKMQVYTASTGVQGAPGGVVSPELR